MNRAIDDQHLTVLALSARDGAPADVEAFARAVYSDVRRFICYLAGANGAEDLTQETFVRVLRSLPTFAGRSSARTWLLSIARRVVVDRYRTAACRPVLANLADWQQTVERTHRHQTPSPENDITLGALLGEVPAERRAPFVLTQLMGLSYAEAAEVLECPVGTIRSRVARARLQLIASLRAADQVA